MKLSNFELWTKTKEKGFMRFFMIRGILMWGIPMFVIMTFFVQKPYDGHTTFSIARSAIIWLLGSALYSFIVWKITEFQYRKAVAKSHYN